MVTTRVTFQDGYCVCEKDGKGYAPSYMSGRSRYAKRDDFIVYNPNEYIYIISGVSSPFIMQASHFLVFGPGRSSRAVVRYFLYSSS